MSIGQIKSFVVTETKASKLLADNLLTCCTRSSLPATTSNYNEKTWVGLYVTNLGGNMVRFTQFPLMITRSTIIYEIISPGAAGSSIYV